MAMEVTYNRITSWLPVQYRDLDPQDYDYLPEEDRESVPGFFYHKEFHPLCDFVRCHNNGWVTDRFPEHIHGFNSDNIWNPLYIELDECGEAVRLYRHMIKEE